MVHLRGGSPPRCGSLGPLHRAACAQRSCRHGRCDKTVRPRYPQAMNLLPKPATAPGPHELRRALETVRHSLLTVGAFSGFLNLMALAPSLYMLQVYDRVLGSRNETTLLALTGLLVGIYLLMMALESIRSRLLVRIGVRLDAELNERIFNATFERSLRAPGSNERAADPGPERTAHRP